MLASILYDYGRFSVEVKSTLLLGAYKSFERMKELAEKLSAEFPFVRVDLYDVDGKVYFSELTFIPTGGNMKLTPASVIKEWGEKLKL